MRLRPDELLRPGDRDPDQREEAREWGGAQTRAQKERGPSWGPSLCSLLLLRLEGDVVSA